MADFLLMVLNIDKIFRMSDDFCHFNLKTFQKTQSISRNQTQFGNDPWIPEKSFNSGNEGYI